MTSMTYWNVASAVQERVRELANHADEMYAALETNDDPGEVAEFLAAIEKGLTKTAGQIGPNVTALRKVAKAMSEVPGVKS